MSHGADHRQLHKLSLMVMQEIGLLVKAGAKAGRRSDCSTRRVMVVMLMRRNATWDAAAAHFHCSQPTVSRRWRPAARGNRRGSRPLCLRSRSGARPRGTALVDGTVYRCGIGNAIPDLYSRESEVPGNERADRLKSQGRRGRSARFPVHGALHDAYAFEASGLKEILQ
jgi:hypothetical protein